MKNSIFIREMKDTIKGQCDHIHIDLFRQVHGTKFFEHEIDYMYFSADSK